MTRCCADNVATKRRGGVKAEASEAAVGTGRVVPLSERQQLAMFMQISRDEHNVHRPACSESHTPHQVSCMALCGIIMLQTETQYKTQ